MSEILLFNPQDEEKRTAIRLIAMRHGVACKEIAPENQDQTIGDLLSGKETGERCTEPFREEMLVMHALESGVLQALLDTLRKNGKTVRLKAVVTETNRSWSAKRLYQELLREEQAIRQWKESAHKKKKG